MGELSAVSNKLIDPRVVLKAGAVFAAAAPVLPCGGSGSTGRPHTLVDSAHTSGQRRPRLFDRDNIHVYLLGMAAANASARGGQRVRHPDQPAGPG